MTRAASRPTPSDAPPPLCAALRTASPPSSTRRPFPSAVVVATHRLRGDRDGGQDDDPQRHSRPAMTVRPHGEPLEPAGAWAGKGIHEHSPLCVVLLERRGCRQGRYGARPAAVVRPGVTVATPVGGGPATPPGSPAGRGSPRPSPPPAPPAAPSPRSRPASPPRGPADARRPAPPPAPTRQQRKPTAARGRRAVQRDQRRRPDRPGRIAERDGDGDRGGRDQQDDGGPVAAGGQRQDGDRQQPPAQPVQLPAAVVALLHRLGGPEHREDRQDQHHRDLDQPRTA